MKIISSIDTIHQITLDEHLNPRIPLGRKRGRPKYKWAERALIEYWTEIRKTLNNIQQ